MMRQKEEYMHLREILNRFRKKVSKVPENNTFQCSMYYLAYLDNHDEKTWNKFITLFSKLDFHERLQVFANVSANLKERRKNKVKRKGND